MMKELTQIQKEDRLMSTDLNSESGNDKMSSERLVPKNIIFKHEIIKVMNKMKELCVQHELQIGYIKWKYLKRNIDYHGSPEKAFRKLQKVIKSMKEELNVQKNMLIECHEMWENYRADNIEHEDSSSNEAEESRAAADKKSEKLRNVSRVSSFCECDVEMISVNEAQAMVQKSNSIVAESSLNDDSDKVVDISPILTKRTPIVTNTTPIVTNRTPIVTNITPIMTNSSPIVTDRTRNKTLPGKTDKTKQRKKAKETSQEGSASDKVSLNVSIYITCNDTSIEIINSTPSTDDENYKTSESDVSLRKIVSDSMIIVTKRKRKHSSNTGKELGKSPEKKIYTLSNTLDDVKRARKVVLTSDLDTLPTTSVIDMNTTGESIENDNLERTNSSETVEPVKKGKKYNNRQKETKDKTPEDLIDFAKPQFSTPRMQSELISDDSLSPILKEGTKGKKLNISFIFSSGDSSSHNSDSNLNGEKQHSLAKGQKKNKGHSALIEEHDNAKNLNTDSNSLKKEQKKNKGDSYSIEEHDSSTENLNTDSNSLKKEQKKNKGDSSSIEEHDNSTKNSKKYFLRKRNTDSKQDLTSVKLLSNDKLKNSIESDKVLSSKIVLKKLPKSVLSKFNNS